MINAHNQCSGSHKRAVMALLLLSVLFLFTACGGQPKPVDRFTGTQGLVIEFAQNAPPETVFEGTAFPVRVLVRDAGATDIPYDRMLLTFSTDPLYLSGGISPYFPARHDPDSIAQRRTGIQGKSAGYPDGELLAFTMPLDSAFSANPVVGQRESPETRILAGVCYAYTTYYAASICVDTNAYAENLRDQPCQTEELSPTGGQGAPVAVTGVKVQALPVVDRTLGLQVTRPYITLTIENVGTGQVVGPDTLDLTSACLLRDIPKEELGTVRVSASLLNSALECQPEGLVRLVDGKGEIRCTVPESELGEEQYAATQNYVTTLVVNLTYLYKSSAETTVKIERTSLNGEDGTFLGGRMTGYEYIRAGATPPQAVLPGLSEPVQLSTIGKVVTDAAGLEWQMLGTSEGQPVSSCDLYANNPDLIPSELGLVSTAITPAWSCACGQTRCVTLSRTGRCLAGLCPAGTYCCTDQKVVPPPGEGTVPTTGTTTGATGASFTVLATVYNVADCNDYPVWSATGKTISGVAACSPQGFYEQVRCQGSGMCDGASYNYKTIKPTREASSHGEIATACGTTPQAHRTIAVNNNPGTPCYIPYGSRVQIDFGTGNPWNGEYIAEDTGSAINGCHIDVFVGSGKDAVSAARAAGLGNGNARVTILEQGTQSC